MKIFQAKKYQTRGELDRAVQRQVGSSSLKKEKTDFIIKGKAQDLKRLRLSTSSMVYGVTVEEL